MKMINMQRMVIQDFLQPNCKIQIPVSFVYMTRSTLEANGINHMRWYLTLLKRTVGVLEIKFCWLRTFLCLNKRTSIRKYYIIIRLDIVIKKSNMPFLSFWFICKEYYRKQQEGPTVHTELMYYPMGRYTAEDRCKQVVGQCR
jgi:hypothetical protein